MGILRKKDARRDQEESWEGRDAERVGDNNNAAETHLKPFRLSSFERGMPARFPAGNGCTDATYSAHIGQYGSKVSYSNARGQLKGGYGERGGGRPFRWRLERNGSAPNTTWHHFAFLGPR